MPSGKFTLQEVKSIKCFGYPLIWVAVILIGGVCVAIVLAYVFGAFSSDSEKESEEDQFPVGFRIVKRHEWKAQPPQHRPEPSLHPIQFIVIMHTGGRNCSTLKECGQVLREIQQYHKQKCSLWDIAPNFLIGGDGRVYEGRGWDFCGVFITRFNINSFGISFIGNFDKEMPTEAQMEAFKKLKEEGVALNKLTERHRVMAQCQFVNGTRSPGKAFFKNITSWDNWFREPGKDMCNN